MHKEVLGAAPFVLGQAMVVRGEKLRGVAVRGILPEEEPKVSDVSRHMKWGAFDSLQAGRFNILIGSEMARSLQVRVGSRLALLVPQGQVTPAGVVPRMKQFTVTGIFEAGHIQFDSGMTFIHVQDAEKLFQLGAPSGLRLRLKDMHRAPMVTQELAKSLSGRLYLRDWSRTNRVWFAAVQTEKRMMAIILMLIIAVAAFNLVSTLVMTVTEKQADIAILRTLGASPRSIMKIFMVQGAVSGILGTAVGVGLGVLISVNVDVIVPFIERLLNVQFLPKEIYLINAMPSELRWMDVMLIGGFSILMAFLATIYPSWNASRVKPAEALRYE
jgi:lipoprotein-releasing system permease protein